jgi:RimJ/RimL family protein N-acetyltransferase
MSVHPELETERLRLRSWRETDVEPFPAFYRDPQSEAVYGGDVKRSGVWRRIALFIGHWQLRGNAAEAAKRVRDFGYREKGVKRLVSYISPENKASLRVAEKLGAVPDGEFLLHDTVHLVYLHTKH